MDGDFQTCEHLIVRRLAHDVFRHELIFQPIVYQVFGRYAFIQQPLDLVNHPFFKACFQTLGNLLTTRLAIDVHTDNQRVHWRQFATRHRMLKIIRLNLDGTDGTLTGVYVRRIMHV